MKKLILSLVYFVFYLVCAGFGVFVMAASVNGAFRSSGVAAEIFVLTLGFLICCFSIATIPLALESLTEIKE